MNIETKYDVGTHIWIIYEHNAEVHVYDDYIVNIVIDENKKLLYTSKTAYEEFEEKDIILYEDTEKLVEKIKEIALKIKEKEENEK